MSRVRVAALLDRTPLLAGLAVVGLSTGSLLVRDGPWVRNSHDVAVPIVLGLAAVALAPSFRRLDLDARAKLEILGTALLVGLTATGVLLWDGVLLGLEGMSVPLVRRAQSVLNGLTVALLVGGLAGYVRARSTRDPAGVADARRDFREMFEKADVGIALNDPEAGTVGRVNERYAELIGYEPAELEGMSIAEISADDPALDRSRATDFIDRAMAGNPQQFDWLFRRDDGSRFWGNVSLTHATIRGRPRLLAFVRDVSDRRRREQDLEKFREIFTQADHGIALTDPETGTIVETNRKCDDLLGYEPQQLEGMQIDSVCADSPEFSPAKAGSTVRAALAGDPQTLDWLLKRRDGSTLWVTVSLKRIEICGDERLLLFFRDISERRANEQELDRHQSELEFFNSLLRHDVLNGITVVRSHAAQLRDSLDEAEREHAETIVEWADNVTEVVGQVGTVLETLAVDGEQTFDGVDLSAALRGELDRVGQAYPEVTIESDLPDEVHVEADELLSEVVGNVLTNAAEHNDTVGLTIRASASLSGDTVTIRITDDGAGVEDERKEAVFHRGETGHGGKTGSGFGLYFVHSMVTAYGGTVRLEDNEQGGATVVLALQAA